MSQINVLQLEIEDWTLYNFGDIRECPLPTAALGAAEEMGELCRAILKQAQGIRGSWEEWQDEIEKECGDVFIKLVDIAVRSGFDLGYAIESRWKTIKQRDWRKDKIQHGIG